MNVAFWVNNRNFRNVDMSDVEHGNPGVGGTEFSAILIAQKLQSFTSIKCFLLCSSEGKFPVDLNYIICDDVFHAAYYCKKKNVDYFVVDSRAIKEEILACFPTVKFLAWGNCFADEWMYEIFNSYNNLLKFICVGQSQYHLMLTTSLSNKACWIYNAVPSPICSNEHDFYIGDRRDNNVVYIGSLHHAKGFHVLAKAWSEVINQVPDAQLYVIGSGKLYGRNVKLGKWGIASEEYENEFMPYITCNGKIVNSVHFLGIMGQEKYKVLETCKVGVPNPSGESETFGYTAVEMQMMGCQVTTIKCPGYIDTVFDRRNLYENVDELASYLVKILKNSNTYNHECNNFLKKFSVEKIIEEWSNLFLQLDNIAFSPYWDYKKAVYFFMCYNYRCLKSKIRKLLHR